MSITRSKLKAMGLTEEQVETIIEDHLETVNPLKEKGKKADELEQKLTDVQKELDDLKANTGDDYKSRYEKEHADFDEYKKTVANEKATAEKRSLYRELLRECGVDAKRLDTILRVTDFTKINVKDGKLDNAEELTKGIKTDWADFIGKTETRGAEVTNPPGSAGTKMTREEIYRKDDRGRYVHDTEARQKALAEIYQSES